MNVETEVKFLSVNISDTRKQLQIIGAECKQPMRLMKRAIIDYPDGRLRTGKPDSFIRVRDEGNKVTLTYKQFKSLTVGGALEHETEVGSFTETVNIFKKIGLVVVSYQESKRETWQLNDYEIVIDEWPWLKPYIEIEGPTEHGLQNVAKQLGLSWENAVSGDVMAAYRVQYPHLTLNNTVADIKEVKFGDPLPKLLKP